MFPPSQTCHGPKQCQEKADIGNEITERCVKIVHGKRSNGIYCRERGMRSTIRINNLHKKMCLHRKKGWAYHTKNVQQQQPEHKTQSIYVERSNEE